MDKQYTTEEIEAMVPPLPPLKAEHDPIEGGLWAVGYDYEYEPNGWGHEWLCKEATAEHANFIAAAPEIIRQLLARVKEAEAVEEMLKGYALENSADGRLGETIYYDENKSQWCVQGFTDSHHDRLYLALQSLIKE